MEACGIIPVSLVRYRNLERWECCDGRPLSFTLLVRTQWKCSVYSTELALKSLTCLVSLSFRAYLSAHTVYIRT